MPWGTKCIASKCITELVEAPYGWSVSEPGTDSGIEITEALEADVDADPEWSVGSGIGFAGRALPATA
jgi:hypothetical protein